MSRSTNFWILPVEVLNSSRQIILCAVNAEKQESRSYLVEQIQGATFLSRGFTPRFQIELTPSGPLVAPDTARGSDTSSRQPSVTRRHVSTGLPRTVHLYRCSVCGKRFEHSSMDATLRAHKNPSGYACDGRHGVYEGMK
jgi:hypothetical protein